MSKPKNYKQVLDDIRARQKSASGDREAVHGIKDPADKGTVTPPDHPDGDSDKKKNLPPSSENTSHEGEQLTDKDTNPSSTGENVPGPVTDGKAKEDAATSPNVSLSKIAQSVSGVMESINALRAPKAAAAPAATTTTQTPSKSATDANDAVADAMEFTPEFHIKLASLIMETEEGVKFAQEILRKAAGAEMAQKLIASALEQQGIALQYAAAYDEQEKIAAEMAYRQQVEFETLYKSASVEQRAMMDKLASVHGATLQALPSDFEKYAYMGGADAAAGMMDQEAAGQAPTVPGGGEEPLSDEDVLALLEQLVASGQISEEEAMAIAEQLQGSGQPEPDAYNMPPEAKAAAAFLRANK